MGRILVAGPSITDLELSYVDDEVRNGGYAGTVAWHDRFSEDQGSHVYDSFRAVLTAAAVR